jgi:methyltransferase (TIGR00027 family)
MTSTSEKVPVPSHLNFQLTLICEHYVNKKEKDMAEDTANSKLAASTAAGPTFLVAAEQFFPERERIIHDNLALQILPFGYRAFAQLMRISIIRNWMIRLVQNQITGGWSAFLVRKRYIDEKVVEAVENGQVNSVVNLGAGFDTRVYRLPALSTVPVWEVDQAVNINPKEKRLQNIFGQIPAHVTLARINFQTEDIATILSSHGYQANTKTFFIWEAVSQYLTESGIRATFEFLSNAVTGSRLAFTYVLKDFIEGENFYGGEAFYQRMVVKDKVWHFGWNPEQLADFLGEYGWRLVEDLSYAELSNRYVKPTGRELSSMEIERIVYAEKL